MTRLFTYLEQHRIGIFIFFLSLGGIALFVQWLVWMFGYGRFGTVRPSTGRAELRYIFSEATVKIINDFRHLLALIIVLIFAVALGYSLWKAASIETNADSASVIDNMKEALQVVVATLGGLVGSIIGYYFGESSVRAAEAQPIQPPTPDQGEIEETTPPV